MPVIRIPYHPRNWALKKLHKAHEKRIVCVCHRRAGKTVACINQLIRDAVRNPGSLFAYIAPTYRQAKDVAWEYLKYYTSAIPRVKVNESELTVRIFVKEEVVNGVKVEKWSRIKLFGAENPDALRGLSLWGCVFDEYAQQPANIYSEVVSKALADRDGYAIWIGTPKGKNDFYTLHKRAESLPGWKAVTWTIQDTFESEEGDIIDNLRKNYEEEKEQVKSGVITQDEFDQEWHCSFEAGLKGAIYGEVLTKARMEKRITKVEYDESLLVHTWWDLGYNDETVILFFQNAYNEWRLIDCYANSGVGFPHFAKVLKNKPYVYGSHWGPHDINAHSMSRGESVFETARKLGIHFRLVERMRNTKKGEVRDGIDAVRRRFSQLWINKKLDKLLEALGQYRWAINRKTGESKDAPLHDWTSNYADALRYWAVTSPQIERMSHRNVARSRKEKRKKVKLNW